MVEIDGVVVEACKKHLSKFEVPWDSPRAEVLIDDGAVWAKQQNAKGNKYDAIIVDSTDPIGPGEALFTNEFYKSLFACLEPHGTISQNVGLPFESPQEIKNVVQRLRNIGGKVEVYRAAIPTYVGGSMGFFVWSKDGSSCSTPQIDCTRKYYNKELHSAAFALPTFWKDVVKEENKD
eukprot:TRINITY_DN1666_c0_g1_i3.p1 TRINITY_DN1666_c0_g1~~TRINITY_DN1666_c0_g1_i3.p1  ORF type:complete len:178 (+),score=33.38 TRINITY_DN1666_c0_g1_i3:485-1018(+)